MSSENQSSDTRTEIEFTNEDEWSAAVEFIHRKSDKELNIIKDGEFYRFAFDENNKKIGFFNTYTNQGYIYDA